MRVTGYKFGAKNNWRRRQWNEIKRRCKKRQPLCVYLPGAEDMDRVVAASKGFDVGKFVAVEKDKKNAAILRRSGVSVVCEDFIEALANWPESHKIDILIADFCGNLGCKHADLINILWSQDIWSEDAVVLVNTMRGREANWKNIKEDVFQRGDEFFDAIGLWPNMVLNAPTQAEERQKHRGLWFYFFMFHLPVIANYHLLSWLPKTKKVALTTSINLFNLMMNTYSGNWRGLLDSYMSDKGHKMDSIVFTWNRWLRDVHITDMGDLDEKIPLRQSIIANLATAQRRINDRTRKRAT